MTINKTTYRDDILNDIETVLKDIDDPSNRTCDWIFATDKPDLTINFTEFPVITYKVIWDKAWELYDRDFTTLNAQIRIAIFSLDDQEKINLEQEVDNVMKVSNFPQFNFKDYSESNGSSGDIGEDTKFTVQTYFVELDFQ